MQLPLDVSQRPAERPDLAAHSVEGPPLLRAEKHSALRRRPRFELGELGLSFVQLDPNDSFALEEPPLGVAPELLEDDQGTR